MYEFTVVPPSLFAPDGTFYKTSDKADLAAELKKLQNNDPSNEVLLTPLTFKNFRLKIAVILQNVFSTS